MRRKKQRQNRLEEKCDTEQLSEFRRSELMGPFSQKANVLSFSLLALLPKSAPHFKQ